MTTIKHLLHMLIGDGSKKGSRNLSDNYGQGFHDKKRFPLAYSRAANKGDNIDFPTNRQFGSAVAALYVPVELFFFVIGFVPSSDLQSQSAALK